MRLLRHLLFSVAPVLALAAVGTLLTPAPVSAFDYVDNGGFEAGTDRWTFVSSGSTFDTEPDDVAAFSGGERARIILNQQQFILTQTSTAGVPAGSYQFSARIRSNSTALTLYAQVSSNSPGEIHWREEAGNLAGEWWAFSGTVTVTGFNNIVFRIGGTGSTGDVIYVDDVRFDGAPAATMTPTDTPLPSTATQTPFPPTATKTPKPTSTPRLEEDVTPELEGIVQAIGDGAILNGGFEEVDAEGKPAPWDKHGGDLTTTTESSLSGIRSARLDSSTESTKWLYQTVRVNAGASYAFEGWLRGGSNLSTAWLRVSWYVSDDGSGEALDTSDSTAVLDLAVSDWQHLTTGAVNAPLEASSAKVRVMLQPASSSHAEVQVDDAWFGPVAPDSAPGQAGADIASTAPGDERVSRRGDRLGTASGSATVATGSSSARIAINEVLYDGIDDGSGSDSEWVELYNPSDEPASLDGWTLADGDGLDILRGLVIPARGYAIVTGSEEFAASISQLRVPVAVVTGHIGNSLGNAGDVVVLVDPTGRFADAVSWGADRSAMSPPIEDVPAGHSIERRIAGIDTDRAGDFVDNERPSPGGPYVSIDAERGGPSRPSVDVLRGESGISFGWLPWLALALAAGALAGVGSMRLLPIVTDRWRHP